MQKNFWQSLPEPFTVLAPMDGVTDPVFRKIMTEIGRPDVFFTEFVNTDGIVSIGFEKVRERLLFDLEEQPIVAQIWGIHPESFYKSAQILKEMGFAGIDLNMGCPVRDVLSQGACSALIKNPQLAKEIIEATKKGADGLPVSVKTRLGFSQEEIDVWIRFLLEQNLPVLSIHLRTVKELSQVPAHWEMMPEIIKLRDKIAPDTLIIGNGDLGALSEIREKYEQYGNEGFMVGRGIFANPWLFNPKVKIEEVTVEERINLFLKHIEEFEKTWGGAKNIILLRKFCKTYIQSFPEASDLREKLMQTNSADELKKILINIKKERV